MLSFFPAIIVVVALIASVNSYRCGIPCRHGRFSWLKSTWQEDLDQFLNIDTSCKDRTNLTRDILSKVNDITNDVVSAVQEQSLDKIAPRSLSYGKAIQGLQAFQNQVVTDLIPDFLTKAVPRLVDEGPRLINQLIEKGPTDIAETGQKALASVRDIAQDPSMLQSTVEELRREIRNVFVTSAVGLQEPSFDVLYTTRDYQVRRNAPYSVCTTSLSTSLTGSGTGSNNNDDTMFAGGSFIENAGSFDLASDPLVSSASYLRLVRYFFGENAREASSNSNSNSYSFLSSTSGPVLFGNGQRLSMTTPVIVDATTLSCVLPQPFDSANAPIPTCDMLLLKDLPSEVVAVREFTGLITEGEIARQKAKLEDALLTQNIDYDPSSFKVLQYNPPYALPWIRRNELSVKLNDWTGPKENVYFDNNNGNNNHGFSTAPEAGD